MKLDYNFKFNERRLHPALSICLIIALGALGLAAIVGIVLLQFYCVQLFWNMLAPAFGFPLLTFWQAAALYALVSTFAQLFRRSHKTSKHHDR